MYITHSLFFICFIFTHVIKMPFFSIYLLVDKIKSVAATLDTVSKRHHTLLQNHKPGLSIIPEGLMELRNYQLGASYNRLFIVQLLRTEDGQKYLPHDITLLTDGQPWSWASATLHRMKIGRVRPNPAL